MMMDGLFTVVEISWLLLKWGNKLSFLDNTNFMQRNSFWCPRLTFPSLLLTCFSLIHAPVLQQLNSTTPWTQMQHSASRIKDIGGQQLVQKVNGGSFLSGHELLAGSLYFSSIQIQR